MIFIFLNGIWQLKIVRNKIVEITEDSQKEFLMILICMVYVYKLP